MSRRTYWHLEDRGRVPSDYDVATTSLLYWPEKGFEVRTPALEFLERHQPRHLRLKDAESLRVDPRQTTYASYTELQRNKEIFVDGIFAAGATDDVRLAREWVASLRRVLGPLLRPLHALQMTACYLGSMAPSGRVVVALAFQAADELRRVQRIAQRAALLRRIRPDFLDDAREDWQRAPAWQPLRELTEHLLATWDWGECFTALQLAIKPAIDHVVLVQLAEQARAHDDVLLDKTLASLKEDADWHRAWSKEFVHVLAHDKDAASFFRERRAHWAPRAIAALEPMGALIGAPLRAPLERLFAEPAAP